MADLQCQFEPTQVTVDVHYNNPGFSGATQDVIVVVDCPTGTVALNGGIVKSVADAGWVTGAATANWTDPGSATLVLQAGVGGGSDPTNASYPRPINSGGSWQMGVHLTFPYWRSAQTGQQNYDYGMTVTYYVQCV